MATIFLVPLETSTYWLTQFTTKNDRPFSVLKCTDTEMEDSGFSYELDEFDREELDWKGKGD